MMTRATMLKMVPPKTRQNMEMRPSPFALSVRWICRWAALRRVSDASKVCLLGSSLSPRSSYASRSLAMANVPFLEKECVRGRDHSGYQGEWQDRIGETANQVPRGVPNFWRNLGCHVHKSLQIRSLRKNGGSAKGLAEPSIGGPCSLDRVALGSCGML